MNSWYVYMVRCKDSSLYTGITTDLSRRLTEHNSDKNGARYTRSRQPVQLVYSEKTTSRKEAAKREYAIKQLDKKTKELLITNTTSDKQGGF